MADVWTNIEAARRQRGLTIESLCAVAGVSARSYHQHKARGTLTAHLASHLGEALGLVLRQTWTAAADEGAA